MRPQRPVLVFVYNADSGWFNTVTDIAHKLLSPDTYACTLCALTHGHFTARAEWTAFLETLDADCEFLHRDEFAATYSSADIELPAVLEKSGDRLTVAIDAAALKRCNSLQDLEAMLLSRVAATSA